MVITRERTVTVPNDGIWHELPGDIYEIKSPTRPNVYLELNHYPEKHTGMVLNQSHSVFEITYTVRVKKMERNDGLRYHPGTFD